MFARSRTSLHFLSVALPLAALQTVACSSSTTNTVDEVMPDGTTGGTVTSAGPTTGTPMGVTTTSAGPTTGGATTGGPTTGGPTTGGPTTGGTTTGDPTTGGLTSGGLTTGTMGAGGASSVTSGTTTGGTGGPVECNLPDLPEGNALTYMNEKLPDPFTFYDGTPVTTQAQWECRRKEILAMAAKYLYAPVPDEPDMVTGEVNGGNVSINVTVGGNTQTFTATIGNGSSDVIALNLGSGVVPQGSKSLNLGSGNAGKIESLYGISGINPNIVNAWMINRVMDVLEQHPDSGHDPTKMVVSGCSGCGKGAYLAGVFSRIPVTVIVESGGGGVANLRQAEWFRNGAGSSRWMCQDAKPQSIDNLEETGICGPWVTGAAQWLRSNPSKVYNLPFDTHLLLATIAPRYLVHFTNNNGTNSWCHLGGTCEALSAWAAKPVWKALGVPERMGFSMYSANHCGASGTQTALAGEMFKLAFDGNTSANTDVMEIPASGVQQPVEEWQGMWVDWNMDTVLTP